MSYKYCLTEQVDSFVISFEMPGCYSNSISITANTGSNVITIKAEKQIPDGITGEMVPYYTNFIKGHGNLNGYTNNNLRYKFHNFPISLKYDAILPLKANPLDLLSSKYENGLLVLVFGKCKSEPTEVVHHPFLSS